MVERIKEKKKEKRKNFFLSFVGSNQYNYNKKKSIKQFNNIPL
jgi:hypothetical protein